MEVGNAQRSQVTKPVLGILIAVVLSVLFACAKEPKTVESAFPKIEQGVTDPTQCESASMTGNYIVEWENGELSKESATNREELIEKLVRPKLKEIKHVEADYEIRIQPNSTLPYTILSPMDPDVLNWGIRSTGSEKAWAKGADGSGIIVAVIDSGVDINHPQLAGRIYKNIVEANGQTGVDDDQNGYVDDIKGWNFVENSPIQNDGAGHGTHVSGIIAADSTLGKVQGVAEKAQILPLGFIAKDGSGSTYDAIRAIKYAVGAGAKVINASWGGPQCSKTLQDTLAGLDSKNVLFVAAGGNSGRDISYSPEYPAAFRSPSQITVGASTPEFLRAGFSNFGELVHVVAPGRDIVSTYPKGLYATMDGTSMATPFVAGQAAAIWSVRPDATAAQIKKAILMTVDTGSFFVSTKGQINVDRSVDYLKTLVP